jgi:hypothetical protein
VVTVKEVSAAVRWLVLADARTVGTTGEVPATVETVSSADGWVVLGVHWLVLTAEEIVLAAATTRPDTAEMPEMPAKAHETVKCGVACI